MKNCKTKLVSVCSWSLLIAWLAVIYVLSDQPAVQSDTLSSGVTRVLLDLLENTTPHMAVDIEDWNHVIRKFAHFFMYLVLGLLLMSTLRRSRGINWKNVLLAAGIGMLLAMLDEGHQLFVTGRGVELKDVLIDSVGVCTGIGLYRVSRLRK